jgi:hypothetical protein
LRRLPALPQGQAALKQHLRWSRPLCRPRPPPLSLLPSPPLPILPQGQAALKQYPTRHRPPWLLRHRLSLLP